MRAFRSAPWGIDNSNFSDTPLMVIEQASGRACAVPLDSDGRYGTDIRDICYRINSVENNYAEAQAIVEEWGWCIQDDAEQ